MGWLQRLLGVEEVRDLVSIRHGMDRRAFLKTALIGSAVAATVDVEHLLWTPKTQIVVPDLATVKLTLSDWIETEREVTVVSGDKAFITPEWVTREALEVLMNNLKFTAVLNCTYEYEVEGAKFGVLRNIGMEA